MDGEAAPPGAPPPSEFAGRRGRESSAKSAERKELVKLARANPNGAWRRDPAGALVSRSRGARLHLVGQLKARAPSYQAAANLLGRRAIEMSRRARGERQQQQLEALVCSSEAPSRCVSAPAFLAQLGGARRREQKLFWRRASYVIRARRLKGRPQAGRLRVAPAGRKSSEMLRENEQLEAPLSARSRPRLMQDANV